MLLLELLKILMALCSLNELVRWSRVCEFFLVFGLFLCFLKIFVFRVKSCMQFVVISVCGMGESRKLLRSHINLLMSVEKLRCSVFYFLLECVFCQCF